MGENKVIPVRATVKADTNWIYRGQTFKVIDWREPGEIEKELGLGREYKLDLIGTEFEEKYKSSPFTWIFDKDLDVEFEPMTEENGKYYRRMQTVLEFHEATGKALNGDRRDLLLAFLKWQEENPW